jgi:uncharacterized protein
VAVPNSPVCDAHRHLGVLPPFPYYGAAAVSPDIGARATAAQLGGDLDRERLELALVIPNYGVPDVSITFSHNDLVLDAAARDERVRVGLYVSARPQDAALTRKALTLAGESGVRALKMSFLLGGSPTDPQCQPLLEEIFAAARTHGLVVHVHTSPGAASDIDQVGHLVEAYADRVAVHLVHLGGGVSGHIKLIGGRFFDWIAAGKRVYTDTSWAIGFAPRWLAAEIERRGIGHDRVLYASDEPWGDHVGELAKVRAAFGDGELGRRVTAGTFHDLYT